MQAHETPLAAAVARASEEMGPFPASNTVHAHTLHRGEGVHTITGDADAPFEPRFASPDMEHGWFTAPEVDELPLHPGFRQTWDVLKPKSPTFVGLSAVSRQFVPSGMREDDSWKLTSTGTTSLSDSSKVADWHFGVKFMPFGPCLNHPENAALSDNPQFCEDCLRRSTQTNPAPANVLPAEVNNWGEDPEVHSVQFSNDFKGT
jgi:hypothetical protein